MASAAPQAALVVYNTQASFLAAVSSPGVDTFAGLSITDATASPMLRSAGSYTYTATSTTSFFGAGSVANPWLSTNAATDTITFSGFSPGVNAIGGLFFGSDVSGAFATGTVVLTAMRLTRRDVDADDHRRNALQLPWLSEHRDHHLARAQQRLAKFDRLADRR